jgi:hypothetical protein
MNKLQAHMALASLSQSHLNKLKHAHRYNSGSHEFSPPSQIVSNYAAFDAATRVPLWHHGFPQKNTHQSPPLKNGDYHHHVHKPEAQQQQQQQQQHLQAMPSVHPSVITPFLEQVHLKQKEVAAEQKNSYKQSHESGSNENNGSFEVVNDIFSKHLVPPPPSKGVRPSKGTPEKEKRVKFNLDMQSPLQDASRFNYNDIISTATTPSSTQQAFKDFPKFRPSYADAGNNNFGFSAAAAAAASTATTTMTTTTTARPNVFAHLNRSKENPYKHHKLLHPSYTGGLKNKPAFSSQDKPFLPTPYKPEKEEEIKIDYEPQHSYFTIEDAVTPHFPDSKKYHNDDLEIITLRPQIKPTRDYAITQPPTTVTTTTTTTVASSEELSSPRPRQKLRRRKPKPGREQVRVGSEEQASINQPVRTRGNIKSNNSTAAASQDNELRTRNRLNYPNRVRARPAFTSPSAAAATLSTVDYDYTVRTSLDDEKKSEVTTITTTEGK